MKNKTRRNRLLNILSILLVIVCYYIFLILLAGYLAIPLIVANEFLRYKLLNVGDNSAKEAKYKLVGVSTSQRIKRILILGFCIIPLFIVVLALYDDINNKRKIFW